MPASIELVVTPHAGLEIAVLDGIDAVRHAFARGPVRITRDEPEAGWFRRFGVARQLDWPAAAFRDRAMADGAPQCYCADPVHLQVSGDAVVLDAGATADLITAEADSLIERLNEHFKADGMRLLAVTANQWLLTCGEQLEATTTPLSTVQGRSIERFLPQGKDARTLKRFGNESQMLMHECAVNEARQSRGQASVNGLWVWGGARDKPVARSDTPVTVLSDALHVRGLAQAAGQQHGPLPHDATALPANADLLVLDVPAAPGDPEAWAGWLTRQWLLPLQQHGANLKLTLALPQATLSADLYRPDLLRLLRRGGLAARLAANGLAT